MNRKLYSHIFFALTWLLRAGLAVSAPTAAAQSIADYANSTAHLTIGSGTATTLYAGTFGAVAPTDLAATTDAMVRDTAGNLYFANTYEIDMYYTADISGAVPPLLQFAAQNAPTPFTPVKGNVYAIAGNGNDAGLSCGGGACGDGSFAVNATLGYIGSLLFDSTGSLLMADESSFAVRKIDQSTGFITTIAGDPNHTISAASANGTTAASSTFVSPSSLALRNGVLYVADAGANVVRAIGTDGTMTTVAGDITQAGTFCSDTTCGEGGPATRAVLGGAYSIALDSDGNLYVSETSTNVVRKVGADGNIHTVAGVNGSPCGGSGCGDNGPATSALLNVPIGISLDSNDNLVIADLNDNAIRAVRHSDQMMFTIAGSITASPSASQAQEAGLDGSPSSSLMLTNPQYAFVDSSGGLNVADTNLIWKVDGPAQKLAQTIEFQALATVTYGVAPITLMAQSIGPDSNPTNLTITYTVSPASLASVDGSKLTIIGAGTVTITASQPGDATYMAATPVTQTLNVQKAPLTVAADDISFTYKSASTLPRLTYHLTGLVHGDTDATAVTGQPVLTTNATATSPAGTYPITTALGTLASVNYTLTPQNGVLTISGGAVQTITFSALSDVTYGASAITLSASSDSGLAVSYTSSGPATILGSRLVVNGVGTVSVTATQAGDPNFAAATPVTETFRVKPAVLTITADNATRAYGAANPAFSYTATGFVNGDGPPVLSGAPVFLPPAASSVPGQYALGLDPSGGTLFASNYTFTFVPGTLTVTKAAQTIAFPQFADTPYGNSVIPWRATASSGLTVAIAATGPITYDQTGFSPIPPDHSAVIGAVTVTATQPGNDLYAAAPPITQTFQTTRAQLQVNANNVTRAFGAANPNFTYYFGGSTAFVLAGNTYSGMPGLTTTADTTSPPGDYPIVVSQGTFTSPVWTLQPVNGTLTILAASSFSLTATPSAVTVPIGQSASVKITLTPLNDFTGSVTIGCGGLPAGVTCSMSPQTLTPVVSANGAAPAPATGVLTIVAAGAQASPQHDSRDVLAGTLLLPAAIGGLLLMFARRRFTNREGIRMFFLGAFLLLSLSSLIACGGNGNNSQGGAQRGTSTIQVTGNGTAADGSAVMNQLNLTITLQ